MELNKKKAEAIKDLLTPTYFKIIEKQENIWSQEELMQLYKDSLFDQGINPEVGMEKWN